MATNQKYTHGKHIALTADKDYASGAPVIIGDISGVAQTAAKTGEQVTIWRDGSYDVEVDGALTLGQAVYITTAGALTATVGSNKLFGYALAAKTSGKGIVEVLVRGNS